MRPLSHPVYWKIKTVVSCLYGVKEVCNPDGTWIQFAPEGQYIIRGFLSIMGHSFSCCCCFSNASW